MNPKSPPKGGFCITYEYYHLRRALRVLRRTKQKIKTRDIISQATIRV